MERNIKRWIDEDGGCVETISFLPHIYTDKISKKLSGVYDT